MSMKKVLYNYSQLSIIGSKKDKLMHNTKALKGVC